MNRRRFLHQLGLVSAASTLSACARAMHAPMAMAIAPGRTPGSARDAEGVWREGAAYARWAPSPHNVQPWKLRVVSATECELLYDPARLLPTTDPTSAFTMMGLAMFVEYLSIAVGSRGYAVHAAYAGKPLDYTAKKPMHFARLTLVPAPNNEPFERSLLLERRTSRLPYDGSTVADDTMRALATISREHRQTMAWSSDEDMVRWVIDLNRFTLFRDLDDAPTRTELKRWIRTTDADARSKKDGLWSHCLRFPGWLLQAFFDQHEKWGRGWRARMCRQDARSRDERDANGCLVVRANVGAGGLDSRRHVPGAGVAGARAPRHPDAGDPFGSVITNPEAYAKLVARIGASQADGPLWLLVRVGKSDAPPHSYRVDTESIFLDDDPQG